MRQRRPALATVAAASLLALGACGSDEATSGGETASEAAAAPAAPASVAAELEHIHGLGEQARTGELFVATHTGLFRAPRGQARLQRAGASRQDTMGFSVVGSDRFLGSGHPDPAAGGPSNLGLIVSEDQGRSWRTVSLAGKADFHVLRSSGRYVYGSSGGRIMVSDDNGRSWTSRTPPADVFDLAIDPASPERVVASTAGGIFGSGDAAASWRRLSADRAGLLAWPKAQTLVLVDAQGAVSRSADGGRTFAATGGSIGGPPSAFVGSPGGLLAALGDGSVLRSEDDGASWQVRATP